MALGILEFLKSYLGFYVFYVLCNDCSFKNLILIDSGKKMQKFLKKFTIEWISFRCIDFL